MSDDELIIVANRLPVEAVTDPDGNISWNVSPGGLVAAVEPSLKGRQGVWIGWNGHYQDPSEPAMPPIPETAEGRDYRIVEVPLDKSDVEQYYDGFSNSALWPLYHDAIATPTYHRHQFDAYRRVNMLFAQAAARAAAVEPVRRALVKLFRRHAFSPVATVYTGRNRLSKHSLQVKKVLSPLTVICAARISA